MRHATVVTLAGLPRSRIPFVRSVQASAGAPSDLQDMSRVGRSGGFGGSRRSVVRAGIARPPRRAGVSRSREPVLVMGASRDEAFAGLLQRGCESEPGSGACGVPRKRCQSPPGWRSATAARSACRHRGTPRDPRNGRPQPLIRSASLERRSSRTLRRACHETVDRRRQIDERQLGYELERKLLARPASGRSSADSTSSRPGIHPPLDEQKPVRHALASAATRSRRNLPPG